MSFLKLAPFAALAFLLSTSAQADPPAKVIVAPHGLISVGWPMDVRGPRPAHKSAAHSGRASLIIIDWPDEIRGAHPTNGVIINGWPLDVHGSVRPSTAPKSH